jgi:hypothetical protein
MQHSKFLRANFRALQQPLCLFCSTKPAARPFASGAKSAPFELKDALKRRHYRWNDGSDGRRRSWYIDVDQDNLDAELDFFSGKRSIRATSKSIVAKSPRSTDILTEHEPM